MGSLDNITGAGTGLAASWSHLPRSEVLAELDRVLESHQFHTSKKCSRFLRHIVEAAVDGRFDCLKERTLGVDVFNREPHYDTNQDPVVRGTAGEVRKRLAQYYLEAAQGELRFSLPPGSYVPEAHYIALERSKAVQLLAPVIDAEQPARQGRGLALIAASLLVSVVLLAALWLLFRPTPLDRFWAPVMTGKTVLVCVGQPQFYTFHPVTARVLNSWFASGQEGQPPSAISFRAFEPDCADVGQIGGTGRRASLRAAYESLCAKT